MTRGKGRLKNIFLHFKYSHRYVCESTICLTEFFLGRDSQLYKCAINSHFKCNFHLILPVGGFLIVFHVDTDTKKNRK